MPNKPIVKPATAMAARIRAAREAAQLTRPQAANLAGIPYNTLVNLEKGTVARSMQLPKLAAVYGVNSLWLETGRGQRASKAPVSLSEISSGDDRESRLIAIFRTAPESVRDVILQHAESLAQLTRKTLK
ncbi:DNA-binding XRE family transcriptional regulator [Dokdonella fugitiva]|uniref:DNA-binding XRE family transcriptional regulator n=1 Tax=Dokdonella fugitiva TaxID=328517 RepID=A0A839EYZ1_9GAMM|nr:helix-turn-helix domain-containing protein [Dokdonella fugitiva]MBA8886130.1 DNA-binding XRE family transcriptional regulator [Dokdonella fugitiva]